MSEMSEMVERVATAIFEARHRREIYPHESLPELTLAQARAAIGAMSLWQPLETVPTDGRWVLAFFPRDPDMVYVGRWMAANEFHDEPGLRFLISPSGYETPFGRRGKVMWTHWMPIPQPP